METSIGHWTRHWLQSSYLHSLVTTHSSVHKGTGYVLIDHTSISARAFATTFRPALRPISLLFNRYQASIPPPPGVKWVKRETDDTSLPISDDKNVWTSIYFFA
jgi:hypothetical protein